MEYVFRGVKLTVRWKISRREVDTQRCWYCRLVPSINKSTRCLWHQQAQQAWLHCKVRANVACCWSPLGQHGLLFSVCVCASTNAPQSACSGGGAPPKPPAKLFAKTGNDKKYRWVGGKEETHKGGAVDASRL